VNPRNVKALGTLGLAYEKRVRETATLHTTARRKESARVSALEQDDLIATAALGQMALHATASRGTPFGLRGASHSLRDDGVTACRGGVPPLGCFWGVGVGDASARAAAIRPPSAPLTGLHAQADVAFVCPGLYARGCSAPLRATERAMALAASAAVGESEHRVDSHDKSVSSISATDGIGTRLEQVPFALTLDPTLYVA